jgi:hypothetical protein
MEVNLRVFVPGEANVSQLAGLTRLDERRVGTFRVEDPVRIVEPDHLVMLDEIDVICLKAAERFVELSRSLTL